MRDNLYYYIYTILALNILLHSFFLRRLSDLLFFTQLIALVLFALVSIYFVFSYEVLESKPYFFTLVFFALVTANSIVVYYLSSDILMLFLSLPGIVGIYVTDVIIPQQRRPEIQTRVTNKKEALKKELKGMEFGEPEVIIEEIKPKKSFGKRKKEELVASKKSSIYHVKKCPRAKAIPRKNKIRFSSRFKAENQGFTPHECVE